MDIQFYPTPASLAEKAWSLFQNKEFVRVLEPSAGEGHLASKRTVESSYYHRHYGVPVDCIEIDVTKHPLLRSSGFDVVGVDFLKFSGSGAIYSHIILNPPFLEGAKHVLKAWDILFEGEVVAILNAETIRNPFSKEREQLVRLIAQHGSVEFVEGAFAGPEAERNTDVDVALVYLKKSSGFSKKLFGDILDGLKREGHVGLDAGYEQVNELAIPGSFIENSVLSFEAAVKAMRQSVFAEARAAKYASRLGSTMEEMSAEKPAASDSCSDSLEWVRREMYKRHADFKNRAWAGILRSTQVLSKLSSGAQKRIESEFETIKQLEFSIENVYGFIGGLIAKQGDIQIEMICDVFDLISRYHSENNTAPYLAWKSNDKHRTCGLSIKATRFIIPGNKVESWSSSLSWDSMKTLSDLDKVFALLDGKREPETSLEWVFRNQFEALRSGERISSSYLDVRFYPGIGTIHFFPRDKKLIDRLNRLVGAKRQWLPPEGERVSDAFWLQFSKAEKMDKEVRAEAGKVRRSFWDDPFYNLTSRDDEKRQKAGDAVAEALAVVMSKHGIDPNALLEAPAAATQPGQLLLAA